MFQYSSLPLFQSLCVLRFPGSKFPPHNSNIPVSERGPWLFSRRADFWLACGGAPVGLMAGILLIFLHGDRELDALDLVLSEFHLGATYGAIIRQRLWRQRRFELLFIPIVILGVTYALSLGGQSIILTSIAMYAAVWHRGRQSLGVARFYQRGAGGPISRTHGALFRGAIYLPMSAAVLAYIHLAPNQYDGEPYLALRLGAEATGLIGIAATLWVITYLIWTLRQSRGERPVFASRDNASGVHPGERWAVLAHALAFGSAYLLGATHASFILVLAVHHEVQYLYFAYAMERRAESLPENNSADGERAIASFNSEPFNERSGEFRTELARIADFLRWPIIGFVGAVAGGWLELAWLAPLGVGGLFCHYWLDGRIWTRRTPALKRWR